jgi:hypothetical protein
MEENWLQLCICNTVQEAQHIKSLLNGNGLTAVILNKQDSSYLFGEHEVFVSAGELHQAKEIINNVNPAVK